MLRTERHRLARDSYAFFAMLDAAMESVVDDIGAARKIAESDGERFTRSSHSPAAYKARQRIKKNAFPDLRGAFLRHGGQLTAPFLRLEKEIDDFAAQQVSLQDEHEGMPVGELVWWGENAGLMEHLDRIELQATSLREEAGNGMRCCINRLAETRDEDLL